MITPQTVTPFPSIINSIKDKSDESINDERVSPTHKVASSTEVAACNLCPGDVWLEAL